MKAAGRNSDAIPVSAMPMDQPVLKLQCAPAEYVLEGSMVPGGIKMAGNEVIMDEISEPRGLGWWKTEARAHVTGRGRPRVPAARLLAHLQNIRALYDLFDDVSDLEGLLAVLEGPRPATMADRAGAHVMALLLNLSDARLPPRLLLQDGDLRKLFLRHERILG